MVWVDTSKNTLADKSIKSSVLINEKLRNAADYICPKIPSDKPTNVFQQELRDWHRYSEWLVNYFDS